jgi:flagellar basal body L-ring protein FlgH
MRKTAAVLFMLVLMAVWSSGHALAWEKSGTAGESEVARVDLRTSPSANDMSSIPMDAYHRAFGRDRSDLSPPHYEAGSLWSDASPFNSPFDFKRTTDFEVGDTIVVEIQEKFTSRDDLKLENETESELNFNLKNLWSVELDRQVFGRMGGAIDYPKTSIQGVDDYSGESKGKQTSQLTHTIACSVKKILPDGRLLIEGRDSRIIGRDKKIFLMSGIVQPEDVDPETRTVSSSRVADSQFRWEGNGPGQNVMKPGLVNRFLDFIPLF